MTRGSVSLIEYYVRIQEIIREHYYNLHNQFLREIDLEQDKDEMLSGYFARLKPYLNKDNSFKKDFFLAELFLEIENGYNNLVKDLKEDLGDFESGIFTMYDDKLQGKIYTDAHTYQLTIEAVDIYNLAKFEFLYYIDEVD